MAASAAKACAVSAGRVSRASSCLRCMRVSGSWNEAVPGGSHAAAMGKEKRSGEDEGRQAGARGLRRFAGPGGASANVICR